MPILAIANRKGGVGKSTVATMIAYGLALWAKQRVLLIDLDSQCNASLILFGGQNWKLARDKGQTIADYFGARFDHADIDFKDYLFHEVGDVLSGAGRPPQISLVPGSVHMEDIEHQLLHSVTKKTGDLAEAELGVVGRMAVMLRSLKRHYPMVIFDCPPGLSFATQAALEIADKVIVPFRPDFVSQFAVDRISRMIEKKPDLPSVVAVPQKSRRYAALANFVSDDIGGLERIEEIEDYHPLMKTRIPLDGEIAQAFNWRGTRVPIETKFGARGTKVAKALIEDVQSLLA
jgi:cellulose biosynthesis protein BcsQ